ncbi:MAG TPA: polysaccharide biosynthesis tyrosine autokinase [Gemmatimonadales bacterium]|nr:polysaccharide biosynthesis tyrosine autokinase [Gemmatimonadales bacterium]
MPSDMVPPSDPRGHAVEVATPQMLAAAGDFDLSAVQPPPDEGVPWYRYIGALRRYKWLILLVILLGTGAGVLATRFLTPEYAVQATIWIESPPQRDGPVRAENIVEGYNWVELLTTYRVLDSVVAKERLYLTFSDPKDSVLFRTFHLMDRFRPGDYVLQADGNAHTFTLKSAEGLLVQTGKPGDSIGARVGFAWRPPAAAVEATNGRRIEFGVTSPRDASQYLRAQLTSSMQENGNFLRLTLTGTDPARLTSTMNTLINQYVDVAAELKKRKLTELSTILGQQLDTISNQLRDAEGKLEGFRVNAITKPSENTIITPGLQQTTAPVVDRYFEQKIQADQLKRDREALETVLKRAKAGALTVDAYQTIPSVREAPDLQNALKELSAAEAQLRELKLKYTEEYKPVQQLAERIRTIRNQTIPAYTEALIEALQQRENDLRQLVNSQSKELKQIPQRTINEQRLNRDVQSIAALHADLQTRYEAAKLAEASAIPDVRILDPAVLPERPTSNSAPRMIFMAFMASIGLALALAILLDQLDKRFRYPEQVTNELGLSILGAIPAIKNLKGAREDMEEASHVVEAFRTVRLNLVHSYGAAGPVLLTVSSPGPGDGKSLVSSNLALSFAEAGYRTVLVDGDIRRGELHRMFTTERIPGLIDYLMKAAKIDDIVRPTSHKNLMLVPCGTRRHHGPELLGSGAMNELMAELKSRYNVVIVDSPPLGAGIDPFVLGTATGNMMLVLRSGETNRQMAEAKIRLLDRLPVRVLGAVINDIRTSEHAYQYYSYVYGYVADEETEPRLTPGPKERAG